MRFVTVASGASLLLHSHDFGGGRGKRDEKVARLQGYSSLKILFLIGVMKFFKAIRQYLTEVILLACQN